MMEKKTGNKIINTIREEMMTLGAIHRGLVAAKAEGPTAGFDPVHG